jgi:hypothetical protein
LQATLVDVKKMNAEINGIAAIYEDSLPEGTSDKHIFLQTDTYMGKWAVDILCEWAETKKIKHECKTIPALNTASLENFISAISGPNCQLLLAFDKSAGTVTHKTERNRAYPLPIGFIVG